jgi:hypothetical protein
LLTRDEWIFPKVRISFDQTGLESGFYR